MYVRIFVLIALAFAVGCGSGNNATAESMDMMGGANDDQPPSGGMNGSMTARPSCSPATKQPAPNQLRLSDPQLAACQMTVVRSVSDAVEDVSIFTYDPSGHLTLEEYSSRVGGMVNRRVSRAVDGQGRPLRIEEDRDGDSVPDTRIVYTYGSTEPVTVTALHDENADGMAEFSEIRTLDANGRTARLERRDGMTSMLNYTEEYRYDDDGREVLRVRKNAAMETLREETKTYDSKGRLTSLEVREGDMRVLTQSTRSTYEETPCQRTTVSDIDGDDNADVEAVETFDDLNRLTEQRLKAASDGTESKTTHVYDGDQLTSITIDANGDGAADQTDVYVYDPQGRLATHTRETQGMSGPVQTLWAYTYFGVTENSSVA